MHSFPLFRRAAFASLTIAAAGLFYTPALRADDALFIGNSYTFGGPELRVTDHGGVPKIVEAIATSKGKSLSTLMITEPGKSWGYHLKQAKTGEAIKAKQWNWVVLQDFSTQPTHAGKPDEFSADGTTLYKQIIAASPKSHVVLYETWARPAANKQFYTGKSGPKTFASVAEMAGELQKNYTDLEKKLEAIDPGTQVELAPVGLAFEKCIAKYPEINLYYSDLHHASFEGDYLSGLVIYATLFHDSPKGATVELPGGKIDPATAAKLQDIAAEVTAGK
jgi:hypothetical protein